MSELDPAALAALDPHQFAQMIKSTPESQLKELMAGPGRGPILDGIFTRLPQLFRADRAGDTNAVIHWNLTGGPGGSTDTYEVSIAHGACSTTKEPTTDAPRLSLTLAPMDFLKLISGSGNPMMMFMTGKVKAKGDLGLAAQAGNLFDMPRA